ncbi:MAG TPA: TadE/TadG family type IV pilus assembly protein [Acidimicrobiales bacterium]|nr:TadE/TadG family type IV pilus assembly protein [Acidimicrobiales bacterium]
MTADLRRSGPPPEALNGDVARSVAGQRERTAVIRRGRRDGGQAAVELALVLPLVATVVLAVVQVGLLVRDQVLVVHAAREAAREAAVQPAADGARQAALAGSGLESDRLDVTVSDRGGAGSRVRVEVRYRAPARVPVVAAALGDVTLKATATMRVER